MILDQNPFQGLHGQFPSHGCHILRHNNPKVHKDITETFTLCACIYCKYSC